MSEDRKQAARERLNRIPMERRQAELDPVPVWFLLLLFAITGLAVWNWWYTGTPLFLVGWLIFILWFGGE